jgi:predicted lipoprotein with Yx(FWY)xxD motif
MYAPRRPAYTLQPKKNLEIGWPICSTLWARCAYYSPDTEMRHLVGGHVVPEKRKLMVVGAAIAAAFALPGCAPAGYSGAVNDVAAGPAANTSADASPSASAEASDSADDSGDSSDDPANDSTVTKKLPDNQVTSVLTGTSVNKMGQVVENAGGFVFYRFDKDTAKPVSKSTCNGSCAAVWHPALTNDGKPKIKGISADLLGTVTRADGSKQLTIGGWPIYTYIGDKVAGTWKGQNVNGTWFVIKPDGTKNLTCVPKISKPVAPPAADSSSDSSSGTGSDYTY